MNKRQKTSQPGKKIKATYNNVPIPFQIIAGLCSGLFVAPFNTIVDRSVIENANGKKTLWGGVGQGIKRLFFTPNKFLTSYQFKWLFFVYSSTYATSNISDHINVKGVDPAFVKLSLTFLVNTIGSLLKDRALTQAFGVTQVRPFPNSSFFLFFMRDIVAIASAFTIPQILNQFFQNKFDIKEKNAIKIAQIASPLMMQFIGTPLHLLGLDIYNRQGLKFGQRITHIKSIYLNALLLRMLRFLPAFGFGGILNIELRNYFNDNYANDKMY